MALNLFVGKDDTFDVEVYAFKDHDDQVVATGDPKEVPADVEPEVLKFTFRKAGYKDSTDITSSSITSNAEGNMRIDIIKLQDIAFRSLLTKWNLTDEQGKAIPITPATVDKLSTDIARVAATEALMKIKI